MKQLTNGFTLIELLVVIAIIALLLSILMPALNRVKEQARAVVSASNQRQAGQALNAYANDYEGYLPPFLDNDPCNPLRFIPGSSIGPGLRYRKQVSTGLLVSEPYGYQGIGYLPNADSLICPADRTTVKYKWSERRRGYFHRNANGYYMSYWYMYFTPADPTEPALALIHRYRVGKSAGNAVVLIDQGTWPDYWDALAVMYPCYHPGGYNTLHLNGRVNFVRDNRYQERLVLEKRKAKYPSPLNSIWFWNPKFAVLDNM